MCLSLACDTILNIARKFFINILTISNYSLLPSIAMGLELSLSTSHKKFTVYLHQISLIGFFSYSIILINCKSRSE